MSSNNVCSWEEYYENKSGLLVFLSDILLHWPYLTSILFIRPKKVLEAGCGPGYHSLFLSFVLRKADFVLVDKNLSVLLSARKRMKWLGGRVRFCQADILVLPFKNSYFDIVISQGTLEHFEDADFQQAIDEQTKISPRIVFSVPSDKYWQQDFGNEVLRSPEEINLLLKSFNNNLDLKVRYYRLDLGIRTKLAFFYHCLRIQKCGYCKSVWRSFKTSFHILARIRRLE